MILNAQYTTGIKESKVSVTFCFSPGISSSILGIVLEEIIKYFLNNDIFQEKL